jgi:septal ring factor EnvC (AmiA/AmiB activator)
VPGREIHIANDDANEGERSEEILISSEKTTRLSELRHELAVFLDGAEHSHPSTEITPMRRLFLFLVLAIVPTTLLLYGCGDTGKARVEVAKKKVLDQIDDALGKMDVQKAEIDTGIKAAKKAVGEIRKAKHQAQAQLELIDEKVRPHQEKLTRYDDSLAKLRDVIKADTPADIAGKTYSVAELKAMAGQVLQARKECEEKIKGFDAARTNMRNVVAALAKKQDDLEARVVRLEAMHAKLEAEMAAAKAMKKASAAMGDSDATLGENLDELEKKMAALSGDVRAELAGESEKLTATGTDKSVSEVDAFLKATQSPVDPVAEIDKILGPAKK